MMPNDEYFDQENREPFPVITNEDIINYMNNLRKPVAPSKEAPGLEWIHGSELVKKAFIDCCDWRGTGWCEHPQVNFEAAAILLAVEKLHYRMTEKEFNKEYFSVQYDNYEYYCSNCINQDVDEGTQGDEWPCSTLLAAREQASEETLDYVAVHLALENGNK